MAEVFTVEGASLPTTSRVVGVDGFEGLCTLYRFDVWIAIPAEESDSLSLRDLIGQAVTLRYVDDVGGPRRTLHGVVVYATWVEGSLLQITFAPRWSLASMDRHSKVFVGRTLEEILKETFQAVGLQDGTDFALQLGQRYRPIEHVCQYRESHHDFAQRWMEQSGLFWWFDHEGASEKLIVTDDDAHHPRSPAAAVRYFATSEEDSSAPDALYTFTHRRTALTAASRVRDYNDTTPSTALDVSKPKAGTGYGESVFHLEDDAATTTDASRAAKLRADEQTSSQERYTARGRVFDLQPGARFELDAHPRAAFNQEYLAVSLRHRGNALAEGDGSASLRARLGRSIYQVEVEAMRATVQYRPQRVTPTPRVEGVEIGFVDGPADSDYSQVDSLGRYKVRLHLDERANPAGEASTWIRMLQPHAGSPEGWHMPLRKGTEVMVAFLGGDPDRPVIAGAMPDADHPSVVTSANHTRNVIHTGSDNRWELEDLDGSQHIDISTPPKNTFLHLGAHHGSHAHNMVASTDGDGLVHQGSHQDIEVGGHKTEEVQKAVKEKYDNTHTVNVLQDVTEIFHATQTTVVDAHNGETYGTHTTEVTGHKIETCASQYTEVAGLLDEHHGTQSTTVDARLETHCATRTMKVSGVSAQLYDSLTVNVGAGGWTVNDQSYLFFDALNYTVMAPEVTETEIVRTEMTQAKWYTIKAAKDSKDQIKLRTCSSTR